MNRLKRRRRIVREMAARAAVRVVDPETIACPWCGCETGTASVIRCAWAGVDMVCRCGRCARWWMDRIGGKGQD